jgi:hypothetical protein
MESLLTHLFYAQARLALGMRHEVVCDVARRLSEFAIQKKNYDRVRSRRNVSLKSLKAANAFGSHS